MHDLIKNILQISGAYFYFFLNAKREELTHLGHLVTTHQQHEDTAQDDADPHQYERNVYQHFLLHQHGVHLGRR